MTFTPSSSFRTCGNQLCRGCQQRAQGRRIRPCRDMRAFVCAMGGWGNQCVQKDCMMSQDVGDTKGLTLESLSPICFSLFPNSTTDRTARFPESKSHISLSHSTRFRLGKDAFWTELRKIKPDVLWGKRVRIISLRKYLTKLQMRNSHWTICVQVGGEKTIAYVVAHLV